MPGFGMRSFSMPLPKLLFLLPAVISQPSATARCGDCWCINSDEDCPDFGMRLDFPVADAELISAYQGLTLASDSGAFQLRARNGSPNCYPYPDTLGSRTPKQFVGLPACVAPDTVDALHPVCALQLTASASQPGTCTNLYSIKNYESESAATAEGAFVAHFGNCGACSTAQDFLVMATNELLDEVSAQCSTAYYIGLNFQDGDPSSLFDALVDCYQNTVGYSAECAKLWAYESATVAALCAAECVTDAPYNGGPPACERNTCIECRRRATGEDLILFAGRTHTLSALTEEIAHSCAEFPQIVHEPCCGSQCSTTATPPEAYPDFTTPTTAPVSRTPAPTPSAAWDKGRLRGATGIMVWIVMAIM